ncbi:fumarylacetoacetase [Pontibacter sp. G13]|uniref:fumarylacetoacetase n=1 Tax=Pontibacter sp. G13 TaxID=3074898 RepID=UPI0028895218|nr:fumarylacetoacetase [Pontibacter sp. G13]WNJ21268.1 fumarylacetoacetase [Pontibacter sp. G13]
MIAANDPARSSWLNVAADSDFSIQNLPFGIFKTAASDARAASAIGDQVVDLAALHRLGFFEGIELPEGVFESDTLNDFIALGQPVWRAVRDRISDILKSDSTYSLKDEASQQAEVLFPMAEVEMLLPVYVRDYTDFYSSEEHATNVGTMFRGKENALMPNWKHLPVGYHGRASSIIVSGTDVHRPKGQTKADDADPAYGPSRLLDFELEMAFIIGKSTTLGDQVTTGEADAHIFGMVLFNDWSARDIQKWEYVPLGPFLGKSFASSISPWIVTLDALEPFRVAGPVQQPAVLPYLQYEGDKNFDIQLEVDIETAGGDAQTVCVSNHKHLYWNINQQLAHHTVNGCNINVGDMMASGTISGPAEGSYGSMLEITWRGTKPVQMPDGTERKFLQDGDSLVIRGFSQKEGVRVGFGEVRGKVLPTK